MEDMGTHLIKQLNSSIPQAQDNVMIVVCDGNNRLTCWQGFLRTTRVWGQYIEYMYTMISCADQESEGFVLAL